MDVLLELGELLVFELDVLLEVELLVVDTGLLLEELLVEGEEELVYVFVLVLVDV